MIGKITFAGSSSPMANEDAAKAQWEILRQSVGEMIQRYEQLQAEYRQLEGNYQALEEQYQQQLDAYQALGQQHEKLKLAQGLGADPELAKETKAKINLMLREIDTCIALLNE